MRMRTSNFISNSYTKEGYISPAETVHGGLLFMYRPMLPAQVENLSWRLRQLESSPAYGDEVTLAVAESLAKHLTDWSEYDEDKKLTRPICVETISRMPPVLLLRLRGIVEGSQKSDVPPNSDRQSREDASQVGLRTLEADQKN